MANWDSARLISGRRPSSILGAPTNLNLNLHQNTDIPLINVDLGLRIYRPSNFVNSNKGENTLNISVNVQKDNLLKIIGDNLAKHRD